jgi:serpin B
VSQLQTFRGVPVPLHRALSLVALAFMAACADPAAPNGAPDEIRNLPRALTPAEAEIVAASGAFAFDLLREVNADWEDDNLFISPLSASMALGMTMNGAAGTTFDEMRQVLGFGTRPLPEINAGYQGLIGMLRGLDPKVTFQLANAIWYNRPFEPFINESFLTDVRNWFEAEVDAADMGTQESVQTINDWAKEQTNGKIDKVIDDTRDLVMLLANAIYFKGDWRDQFDKSKTRPAPFTTLANGEVQVPTMERNGPLLHGSLENAAVFELPYGGNAFAMTILLPNEGVDVNDFVASLSPVRWQQATAHLVERENVIHLPKFTLAWKDTLNAPLQRLGMQSAFVEGQADFTNLSQARGRDLFVSFVRQDAFVDVNEEGTEAAAVTTVGIVETSAPLPAKIDRPFVFAIRERLSGTILFVGKIVDPRG